MEKSAGAFRTISEVSAELDVPQHVLRFWEQKFPQIKPLKRGGGRRYYRPADVEVIRTIRRLLYSEGYTIRGVQRLLKTQGGRSGGLLVEASGGDAGEAFGATGDALDAVEDPFRDGSLGLLIEELRRCKSMLDRALVEPPESDPVLEPGPAT